MKIRLERNAGERYIEIEDTERWERVKAAGEAGLLPQHIGVIMDGNGRWAKARGLARIEGHKEGAKRTQEIIRVAKELHIPAITFYTFSTENWKRPREEVSFLFSLLHKLLEAQIAEIIENDGKLCFVGELSALPSAVREVAEDCERRTAANTAIQVNLAVNYGGRDELTRAFRSIAVEVAAGKLKPEAITEELISSHLDSAPLPDPDLIIRTAGELRLSNFLTWQSAYSELWFSPKELYWPDFDAEQFTIAMQDFLTRKRRFGGLDDKQGAAK